MSMPTYNSGITYNSGAVYWSSGAPPNQKMAKVKLELQDQSDEEIKILATLHKTALTTSPGNTQYPTPTPTPAVFDLALANYTAKLAEIGLADTHLGSLRSEKDQLRKVLEQRLTERAAYVQGASGSDAAIIQNSGFAIQSDPTPTTSLPKPQNVAATTGLNAGEIKITCKAIPKAKSYIWECRTHDENAAPGPWTQVKVSGKASMTAMGLISGKKYAFRVRAIGPNDIESPWSDEAVAMSA
jgi:hypothetical protein